MAAQELRWTLDIVPELVLAGLVLVLLPVGVLVPASRRGIATWVALVGLALAAWATATKLNQSAHAVFGGTYVVDPFALYFKLFAIAATALTLLATVGHFRGQPQEGAVPGLLVLTCLGIVGLSASQDLALIALFVQITTVGSYVLVGMAKGRRSATEGALKLFLFSAVASSVMIYGMTLLFGLTGTLRLPELAQRLPSAPAVVVLVALCFVLAGYGYEMTLAPFHFWAPDTYQGAPTPISGFVSVGPKAAGIAVLLRTVTVMLPGGLAQWPLLIGLLAALTMTIGNVFALRQSSVKRLLAYSSIGQVGYILVGIATAGRSGLAVPGALLYLAVYLFMNLGAFLAVEALERRTGSDHLKWLAGSGRIQPLAAAVLALCLLSLAGFPPLGGFIGKTLLFGAALDVNWDWLAIVMAANVALSLFYYVRVLEALYLRNVPADETAPQAGWKGHPGTRMLALRCALGVLGLGALASGIYPQPFVTFAAYAAHVLGGGPLL